MYNFSAGQSQTALQVLETLQSELRNYRGCGIFVQGGATMQFAAVPLNMLGARSKAGYLVAVIAQSLLFTPRPPSSRP